MTGLKQNLYKSKIKKFRKINKRLVKCEWFYSKFLLFNLRRTNNKKILRDINILKQGSFP